MINIWDFEDSDVIKIIDVDDKVFIGNVIDITDAEERSDLEKHEDGITIDVDGVYIEFLQSEIKNIELA